MFAMPPDQNHALFTGLLSNVTTNNLKGLYPLPRRHLFHFALDAIFQLRFGDLQIIAQFSSVRLTYKIPSQG